MLLFIDADNAMGSPTGDVDDGFAVAALLLSGEPVAALASVRGNTSEERADRNNRQLAQLCGYEGPCLRGASRREETPEAARFLLSPGPDLRFVAFGPLTNLASALIADRAMVESRIREVVLVGSNAISRGRWPPLWPHEFNLTKDLHATHVVFGSAVPLTVAPLDLLKRMRVSRSDLEHLRGDVGAFLRSRSLRWLLRARILKWSASFPLWDLVAAMYVLGEPSIRTRRVRARIHRNGRIEYGAGEREVTLLCDFDRDAIWSRFVSLLRATE